MFNDDDDQSMDKKRSSEKTAIRICKENTAALNKVNAKLKYYLDRLPLEDQSEVIELNQLIQEQDRLVRVRLKGHIPLRIEVFNENERYRATHLRKRYRDAQRREKIRKPD